SADFRIPHSSRSARVNFPLKACGRNKSCIAGRRDFSPTKKAPEFRASDGENGAKLRSLSCWREFRLRYTRHQPELVNICRYSGNGRNNIEEFSFWQEKN